MRARAEVARPPHSEDEDPAPSRSLEDLLDQALEESFPASDPVAVLQREADR